MSCVGTAARSAISENGKEVIDGFEACKLDIGDYFPMKAVSAMKVQSRQ
jgi:hypothetical protein